MEMNTRLQVEHPVTEMVWGLDLVEWQLRVSAGERLPLAQDDLAPNGHAMEARVYAEDPGNEFLPTGGRVLVLDEPRGDGVRVDSGLSPGIEVGAFYDPMLSKVIAWGADRPTARRRLDAALASTTILGVTTNIPFLRRLLAHPDVAAGRLDTGLVERDVVDLVELAPSAAVLAAATLAEIVPRDAPVDAWGSRTGWRVGDRAKVAGLGATVQSTDRGWTVSVPGRDDVVMDARWDGDDFVVGGVHTRSSRIGRSLWVGADGAAWRFTDPEMSVDRSASGASAGRLGSPMPGTVAAVLASVGDTVEQGRPLVVVEAMKMEHTVRAPTAGVVVELPVGVGQKVALGQLLVTVDAVEEEER
jgi:acetyl-CoA/propionyl-CoA carboxylase biotin carboxyl carrier protein